MCHLLQTLCLLATREDTRRGGNTCRRTIEGGVCNDVVVVSKIVNSN